jgi:hypothetical protein
MGISAGASGAIFGLLGVGFVFERLIYRKVQRVTGERLRRGPYTGLVVINLLLGVILTSGPVRIDNGAHIGGLLAGCAMTVIMLSTVPNKLVRPHPKLAVIIAAVLALTLGIGAWLGTSAKFLRMKINQVVTSSDSIQTKYDYLSDGIRAFPNDKQLKFDRGELLIYDGDIESGLKDFELIRSDPEYRGKIERFAEELKSRNHLKEYVAVRKFILSDESD